MAVREDEDLWRLLLVCLTIVLLAFLLLTLLPHLLPGWDGFGGLPELPPPPIERLVNRSRG